MENITINSSATNSHISAVETAISNVNFGCNFLDAGNGNDTLFGNMNALTMAVAAGSINSNIANGITSLTQSDIHFGNNTLQAGSGNNTLIRNMASLVINPGTGGDSNINFGNNNLSISHNSCGGWITGTHTLVASVESFSLASSTVTVLPPTGNQHQYVSIQDTSGNIIHWGNDTLTGAGKSDTFVFALANTANDKVVMEGNDVILNFNNNAAMNGDTLQFNQFNSSGDLASHVSISHEHCGRAISSVLHFDGGGSLTLLGLNINSLNDMHHINIA